MAVTKEVFANVASCVATSTYGTTAPAQGTAEVWTMGTGNGSFPAAQTSAVPNTFFYASDPADSTHEVILVTDNSTTNTWHVTRGALGTTPVAHASGATYVQVASHGTFQNLKQAPSAAVSTVTVNSTTETTVATYTPTTDELVAGATWEAIAFGTLQRLGGASPGQVTWKLKWGSTVVASCVTGTNGPTQALTTVTAGNSFDVNGSLTLIDSTHAVANVNYWWQNGTTINNELVSSGSSVVVSGSGPITLTCTIGGTLGTSQNFVIPAPLIYRAA